MFEWWFGFAYAMDLGSIAWFMTELAITSIRAGKRAAFRRFFVDVWAYRDLLGAFLMRDVKVRYKQTILGVLWVLIQPLATAGAFALIFGGIAKMPVGGMPYPLFYLVALVPWSHFATSLTSAASSMESSAGLISKVYFPRVVVPLASLSATLPDFLIGSVMVHVLALHYGLWSIWLLLLTPLLYLTSMATAAGAGLLLAALNAQYRDVRYMVPFLVQLGMLASPLIYPITEIPERFQMLLYANPLAGVLTCYRWAVGGAAPDTGLLIGNVLFASLYLAIGCVFFRWKEGRLVDVL
jgi:lipopolysaccharide transport system permease protein